MFITNIKFIMQSTTPFIAIAFVLLLAAICYVAIKCPAKLHSIGTITIVFGLLCFSVALVSVFEHTYTLWPSGRWAFSLYCRQSTVPRFFRSGGNSF